MTEQTRSTRPPLRADAERNRRLIMETAERLFAQRGSVVPLNEIAHAAGVGVGTVYRRFPDVQSLLDALFTERFTAFMEIATAAAKDPDPGRALTTYLLEAARWRADDRALEVILGSASIEAEPIAGIRDEFGRRVDGLVERAVAAGVVREDFASADVYAFLYMMGAIADRTQEVAPGAWRRYADAMLTGFGLRAPTPEPTAAMTDGQVRRTTWPRPAEEG
ncbi:TetR/AcrR family transcriptional regulator [Streptomyces sp. NPDC004610]|uniref:TetR/AcrR family transcriptional regulator n=1 Tax=unclassified Streptomyces TaxID=2593676 RepID=UPI0033BEDBF2